jgi:5-methylcytosine-specific restriction endonuclease McrA
MLKLNQNKFDEALIRHKKILGALKFYEGIDYKENQELVGKLMALERTGRELSLAYAQFKCEKCKAEERLQFHHLIMREVKYFTDFYRYESQRKYWANILILCSKCHSEAHTSIAQFPKHKPNLTLYIQPELIEKVKRKFFIEEELK